MGLKLQYMNNKHQQWEAKITADPSGVNGHGNESEFCLHRSQFDAHCWQHASLKFGSSLLCL